MKKVIALLLTALLLAGVLGSLAYASTETTNYVHVWYQTEHGYIETGDSFTVIGSVIGTRCWASGMQNDADATEAPVTNLQLDLDLLETTPQFDWVGPETPGPPYHWSFGNVPQGMDSEQQAGVGYHESPDEFNPGFHVWRSATIESGVQHLTVTVKPMQNLPHINVDIRLENIVYLSPEITSVVSEYPGWVFIAQDGKRAFIAVESPLTAGVEYTFQASIDLNLPEGEDEVEFMPQIHTHWHQQTAGDNVSGNSTSYDMPGIGTWGWTASPNEGSDYQWNWGANELWLVKLAGYPVGPGGVESEVGVDFVTLWSLHVPGDEFIDSTIIGREWWSAHIQNIPDSTGEIYGLAAHLNSEVPFNEFHPYPDVIDPPNYEWFDLGSIQPGEMVGVSVDQQQPEIPVEYTPGFDVFRDVSPAVFYGPGPHTQTMTVTIIPQLPDYERDSLWVGIHAQETYLVKPTIQLPDLGPDIDVRFEEDGQLNISPQYLPLIGEPWTFTLIIDVELQPGVPCAQFAPGVSVLTGENLSGEYGLTIGDHVSYSHDGMGTWTLSAEGNYAWHLQAGRMRIVDIGMISEEITENYAFMSFHTMYNYTCPDDEFFNHVVPGQRQWGTVLSNRFNEPPLVIDNATVSLATLEEFGNINTENLDPDNNSPPLYRWLYSGIEPWMDAQTFVSYEPDDLLPEPFEPGLNASRTIDITRFDSPDWQTLVVKVKPEDVMPWFTINVRTPEDTPANAYIDSCYGATDYNFHPDGRGLSIWESQPAPWVEYTYTIRIWVEPGDHPVEIWPFVEIQRELSNVIEFIGEQETYSKEVAIPGTWTWDMSGTYPVVVAEQVSGVIRWEPQFAELINQGMAFFQTFWTHIPSGNKFINNGEVPGNISHTTQIINAPDSTGEPFSNVGLELDPVTPYDLIRPPVQDGPPYHWFWGSVPNGDIRSAFVRNLDDSEPFNPGFDASWLADLTVFSQPGIQTLTISVTPRQEFVDMLIIDIFATEDNNVAPRILSVDGADDVFINQDGHSSMIAMSTPDETEYTISVAIEVTPKVPQVKYRPTVRIYDPGFVDAGQEFGSEIGREMPEVGTWTWSTEDTCQWTWIQSNARAVVFPRDSIALITEFSIQHMSVDFNDSQPNGDRIAVSEATLTLDEVATYDLSNEDVIVYVDGVEIVVPAGSFAQQGDKEKYTYSSPQGEDPEVLMKLDLESGEWSLKVSNVDASAIDNSDGVTITLSIGEILSATQLISMQVGGLTYIAGE